MTILKKATLVPLFFLNFLFINITFAASLYSNNFDGGELFNQRITGKLLGVTSIESVQEYASIAGFDGLFLRNTSDGNPASPTIFSLNGFEPLEVIEIQFSLAIIDSWDGTSFPPNQAQAPDFFNVTANDTIIFSGTFTNLSELGATQLNSAITLAKEVQLGFESGLNRLDSAYLIKLTTQANASGELELQFFASGSGWIDPSVSLTEESWAIDNIQIYNSVNCTEGYVATVTPNLDIHLPSLNYQSLTETLNLWVELEFYGYDGNDLVWKLDDYGENKGSLVGCEPDDSVIVSPNLDIQLLSIDYTLLSGTQNLWANFEYYGQGSQGELLWKLIDYGENQ